MLAIRKLNNNAVICRDSRGREVVALGKGVGFGGDFPRELAMDHIERTFYSIDAEGQRIMQDLPADVVLFTAKIMDIVENELPYELSPNAVLIMADHIAFAIARQRKGIRFDMPLTYDVQQLYPLEYKIGRYITARVRQELGVELPREEVASIAMNLVNAKTGAEVTVASDRAQSFERLLNDVTDIVEYDFRTIIDRESFEFSRFATHVQYLFKRIKGNDSLSSANLAALCEFARGVSRACAMHRPHLYLYEAGMAYGAHRRGEALLHAPCQPYLYEGGIRHSRTLTTQARRIVTCVRAGHDLRKYENHLVPRRFVA